MKKWIIAICAAAALLLSAACAEGDLFELPADTTQIEAEAFRGDAIEEIRLPEGIERIESLAFADSGAQYVNLPATLSYIAPDAFDGCPDLAASAPSGSYAAQWCRDNGVPLILPLDVESHTQAQIQAFMDEHPSYTADVLIYERPMTLDYTDPGTLADANLQSALNRLNQIRYIAGLNADVVNAPEWEDAMMAVTTACKLNNVLSHSPARPSEWAGSEFDALYSLARSGGREANICADSGARPNNSLFKYMGDSDSSNINAVGHRRWVLNPSMSRTTFGGVKSNLTFNHYFSAMYAFDMTGSGAQTRIAWPAQQTPLSFFSTAYAWSLSLDHAPAKEQVRVTLRRESDGKVWRFSSQAADGDFYVNDEYCGTPGCVIFRPGDLDSLAAGDRFTVTVRDESVPAVYRYEVNFFKTDESNIFVPAAPATFTAKAKGDGVHLDWSAVEGVERYYVCRTDPSLLSYGIIADVAGTSYIDTDPQVGERYMYYVCPHTDSVIGGFSDVHEVGITDGDFDGTWGTCGYLLEDGVMTVYPGIGGSERRPNSLNVLGPWYNSEEPVTEVVFLDGVVFPEDCSGLFNGCPDLTSIRFGSVDTSQVQEMFGMFYGCKGLTELDLTGFVTSTATNISSMFSNCENLESVNTAGWDTSSVTKFYGMFYNCKALKSLDLNHWDTGAGTMMDSMFQNCTSLAELRVDRWDTSKAEDLQEMFSGCSALTQLDLSNWNVEAVENAYSMFERCTALETLDLTGWKLSKVTYFSAMFYNCKALKALDLSGWDTTKATNMSYTFSYCRALETVKLGSAFTFKSESGETLGSLPSGSWTSAATGATYTSEQIATDRGCIADTYTRVK